MQRPDGHGPHDTLYQVALDTSQGAALALKAGAEIVFSEVLPVRGRRSDATLVPWILNHLEDADLSVGEVERWTVGTGPGSFSGIRVGIALVKGICAGARAHFRGVPSSLALARSVGSDVGEGERVGVLHDARRGQMILSVYRLTSHGLQAQGDASIIVEADLRESGRCEHYVTVQPEQVLPLAGDSLGGRLTVVDTVDAALLLDPPGWTWPESKGEAEASTEPIYVRPPVFVKPGPVRTVGRT